MDTSSPVITAETANHVLFHFGCGGYQAGSFTTHLLSAFATADEQHFHRLAAAFPEYAAAVAAIQYDPHGVINLRAIARGEVAAEAAAPQCPEALLNPETGDIRRCVQRGRHDWHQTPSGTQWRVPVDGTIEVPF
ncbi:hypothetical protein ACIRD2_03325 [Streptomyces sp. NPDC093595]|uniref:hypothetical protein n=1 Tax=Streptomyces sp. NPDC093595 TaxID=3366045 RepID=UPI00380592B2